jgi:hypothetical protein
MLWSCKPSRIKGNKKNQKTLQHLGQHQSCVHQFHRVRIECVNGGCRSSSGILVPPSSCRVCERRLPIVIGILIPGSRRQQHLTPGARQQLRQRCKATWCIVSTTLVNYLRRPPSTTVRVHLSPRRRLCSTSSLVAASVLPRWSRARRPRW